MLWNPGKLSILILFMNNKFNLQEKTISILIKNQNTKIK